MIALDDAALTRLCLGACAVPRHKRRAWLTDIAMRLEELTPTRATARRTNGARQRKARRRQMAWRARQRDGVAIYPVPASHPVVNFLIDLGWLGEAESADRKEVGRAIGVLLDDTARHHRKNSVTR